MASGARKAKTSTAVRGDPRTGGGKEAPPIHNQQDMAPPSLFDLFYEELLNQLMENANLADSVPDDFMKLQTDIDRVEYLIHLRPFVQEFEISTKMGIKSLEKSNRYREEGNKLFQADQCMQSILFYNKAVSYAPHPNFDTYQKHDGHYHEQQQQQQQQQHHVQFPDDVKGGAGRTGKKPPPSKYEALSFCYANRSASLRRLGQYEDCLKDIARAAKFGYPKENLYKLWERKGKCYQGLKRFEMAVKCYRQALQSLKESALSDNQKTLKANEIQTLIKDIRSTHIFLNFGSEDSGGDAASPTSPTETPLMGATGPIVIVPEPEPRRKLSTMTLPPPDTGSPAPSKPERRSFRRKKTVREKAAPSPLPSLPNDGEDSSSLGGGSGNESTTSLSRPAALASSPVTTTSPAPIAGGSGTGELHKANSQMSISQLSTTGIKPDIEVPELSYGLNLRMPSASAAIDLRFAPDKGRYFVATQDLSPGDVVLREEPYAAVLEAIFRVNHCAHCLKKIPTPIPCYECATVQYCSEACRDLSWAEYHKIECGILAYLEPSRYLGKMPHLALRIITKTGLQSLIQHSMMPLMPTLKNGEQEGGGGAGSTLPMFDPTSYRSVHNLATNTDRRPFEDLIKKTAEAIFMAKCLKFNGFFSSGTPSTTDTRRAEIFVSSLLLRHLQIASTNGLEMAECILKNNDVTKFDIIPVGGAIFPTMSFFNHSCYPNAIRLGYQNYQVVRIIRSVSRGEEVNIDYGFDFYANLIELRMKRSQSQYFFTCQCLACTQNWPVYNELVGKQRQYKVKLTSNLTEEVARQAAAYTIGMDFLLKLDVTTAMPIFRDYLIVMNELLVHPDARYIDCEEAYKQCLWLENRGYKSKIPVTVTAATPADTFRQISQTSTSTMSR